MAEVYEAVDFEVKITRGGGALQKDSSLFVVPRRTVAETNARPEKSESARIVSVRSGGELPQRGVPSERGIRRRAGPGGEEKEEGDRKNAFHKRSVPWRGGRGHF